MGVEIRTERKPTQVKDFKVELVELSQLIPHEMTIEHALEAFKYAVQFDGVVRHPIVLDKSSNLILDGHHRHAGLLALGFKYAPAILIDYMDESLVSLDTWYPKIHRPIREIISKFELEDLEVDECSNDNIDFEMIRERKVTAIIGNKNGHWKIKGDRELLFSILRDNWLDETIYYDNAEHCVSEAKMGEAAIISWSYTKQEILELVKAKKISLPKTTRHTIHYAYQDCNYPLGKLPKSD
ncbi:MAG: hypothetical protein GPJ54_08940 [Candidatus Heimdallarchaeota archaeon]|nr:hypothetical protein [Candidatus Heimdallarchaeota archaeon]